MESRWEEQGGEEKKVDRDGVWEERGLETRQDETHMCYTDIIGKKKKEKVFVCVVMCDLWPVEIREGGGEMEG